MMRIVLLSLTATLLAAGPAAAQCDLSRLDELSLGQLDGLRTRLDGILERVADPNERVYFIDSSVGVDVYEAVVDIPFPVTRAHLANVITLAELSHLREDRSETERKTREFVRHTIEQTRLTVECLGEQRLWIERVIARKRNPDRPVARDSSVRDDEPTDTSALDELVARAQPMTEKELREHNAAFEPPERDEPAPPPKFDPAEYREVHDWVDRSWRIEIDHWRGPISGILEIEEIGRRWDGPVEFEFRGLLHLQDGPEVRLEFNAHYASGAVTMWLDLPLPWSSATLDGTLSPATGEMEGEAELHGTDDEPTWTARHRW